jgi:transcriptional regulator with XRE-family HTH domain
MDKQFIKKTRLEKNLSKSFIAKKLNLSRSTYDKVESGQKSLTYEQLGKLAEVFEMPIDNLVSYKDFDVNINILPEKNSSKKTNNEIRINTPQKNINKLKEVFIYILVKAGNKPNVGESVINKILYFIDFDYYEKYEKQLIGATYIHNHFGPTPCELKMVINELMKNQEILEIKNKIFDYQQKKYIPLRQPDLNILSAQEIIHIDEELERLSNKNAKEICEYSHQDMPYKMYKNGDIIDYESVFYRDDNYSVKTYPDEL